MNKSKNTTIGGIIQFILTLGHELLTLFDGDSLTNPNWTLLVTSGVLLFTLFKAKDSGVTGVE